MAVVMITAKATMPMNMLGKPNTELCGVCMTWPQEIHGFTSQTVTWFGSLRTSSFSSTRAPEASQPTTPVISRSQANGRSRVIGGRGRSAGAGPEPGWCTVASPAVLEMLGMEYESFLGRVLLARL